MIKILGLIIVSVGLISCGMGNVISGKYSGEDRGYVALSIVAETGIDYNSYAIYFKDGLKAKGEFEYSQNMWPKMPRDFDNESINGVVITQPLPPGEYYLEEYVVYKNSGAGMFWRPNTKFRYEFNIISGRISYLGRYRAKQAFGKNVLGMSVDGGAVFVVENMWESDKLFVEKKLGVSPENLIMQVPNISILE